MQNLQISSGPTRQAPVPKAIAKERLESSRWEQIHDSLDKGLPCAIPVLGVGNLLEEWAWLRGTPAQYPVSAAILGNLGSTIALGSSLVFGAPALTVGLAGLAACGAIGVYGHWEVMHPQRSAT